MLVALCWLQTGPCLKPKWWFDVTVPAIVSGLRAEKDSELAEQLGGSSDGLVISGT